MPTLTPAAELARAVSRPFPNEPQGYRAAREALMAEEIELRRHLAAVAEQRRALPMGGEVPLFRGRNSFTAKDSGPHIRCPRP